MKKIFVLISLILAGYCGKLVAQDVNNVFSTKEIVWFGIDFSNVKFVGDTIGFAKLNDIRDRHFKAINDLFISEPEKYNPKLAFKKDKVTNDLSIVEKRNLSINIDEVLVTTENTLSKETIDAMINEYKPTDATTGIGVCFVMENLIKSEKNPHATLYVVFFDIATKTVLISEKVSSKASGIGFRNFWARTALETLNNINMPALENKYKK